MKPIKRVAVVHLDCGIGGAEQLMVLASLALQIPSSQDEKIELTMFTSNHDKLHSFSATNDGRVNVKVYGGWIPRSAFGYGTALFSYIRMIYTSICMVLSIYFTTLSIEKTSTYYDVTLNDQVSVINPILKLITKKLIFYCHFPDQLLAEKRSGKLRAVYRKAMDFLEEFGMMFCDYVFVNSIFTRSIYIDTFRKIVSNSSNYPTTLSFPEVLYPPVDLNDIPSDSIFEEEFLKLKIPKKPFFLSINRYQRKKNIELAINAFSVLRDQFNTNEKFILIIAGGYDKRVSENLEYFQELVCLASSLGFNIYIDNDCIESTKSCFSIVFMRSISDKLRWTLLKKSIGLIYTPENEHFGIVPCEAMAVGTPVIACNSGGPMESIVDSRTGFLCENSPNSFAKRMNELIEISKNESISSEWKNSCRERVEAMFSLDAFQRRLNEVAHSKTKIELSKNKKGTLIKRK
ncbi:ALG-2 like mannosyltransferase [Cryptosporidium ryanae]|uniref:ALG-2 like mannosyltransferase n=1 Tax=Cryptosporidium ryanae TaxID=515981 RepID=UPI003519F1A9|nr:ALG-2 like mannosyltransferase [Cryptosporidium ryanae]